jgi:hypothetical protein
LTVYGRVVTPSCAVTVIVNKVVVPKPSALLTLPVKTPAGAISAPEADIPAFGSDLVAVTVRLSTLAGTLAV